MVIYQLTSCVPFSNLCSCHSGNISPIFQKYDYVLHPRTSGFVFLTQQLLAENNLDALYDVTLVYPDMVPQNEKMLLKGQFPKEVKVHFVR